LKDARVTIFANFIEPQVTMPMADSITSPLFATAQSGRKKASEEARKKSESGSVVSDIKSFADTTFEVVNTVSEIAAKLAPLVAFMADKPSSLRPSDNVVVMPGTDLPGFHGLDNTVKLQGDPEGSAGFDPGVLGESIGNPSIYSCVQTPGIRGTFAFGSGVAAGTQLFSVALGTTGHSARVGDTYTVSPLSWYAPMFKFWRGGIKVFTHFVTSSFVTARLRIVWIPAGHSAPATIADNESGDYVSQVIEVTGCIDHAIMVPYVNDKIYKRTSSGPQETLSEYFNDINTSVTTSLGTLVFYLVTPIVTVDSAIPATISALVWTSAAEDFKFSNYSGQFGTVDGEVIDFGSAAAQTSVMGTFAAPFQPIVEATTSYELGIATSEEYQDVVTLGKRYSVERFFPSESLSIDYTGFSKWDRVVLKPASTGIQNAQQWLTAPFVNFRGSVRYKFFWNESFDNGTSPLIEGNYRDPGPGVSFMFSNAPVFATNNKSNNYVSYELPWNTSVPFLYRTDNSATERLDPKVTLPVTAASTLTPMGYVAVAFGDDFAVGVFQALPTVTITPPPALLQSSADREVRLHINK